MASTAKCSFCGAVVTSDRKTCPECGAANPGYVEDQPRRIMNPTTIEELKEYCAERGMPLLRMRFFVGEDFREPKAFGIYRDGDEFIVYKNKADGSRAVRYRGRDEAFAVHELHAKLLDECHKRNIYPDGRPENVPDRGLMPPEKPKNRKNRIRAACIVIACAAILAGFIWYNVSVPKRGYYRYHDTTYYCSYQEERNGRGYHNGWEHWYAFDGTGWKISEQPAGKLITLLSYRGDRADSAWGSGEFILWTEHSYEDGYYLCDGAYWYYSTRTASLSSYYRNHWYRWYPNSSHPHWAQSSDFPRHDGEGYVIDPKAYYVGNERPPEWTCQDFGGRVGYYKDYNTLYYCTDKNVWYEYSEDYYRKSLSLKSYKIGKRWHSSSVLTPSGNMSYLGKIYRSEWGGCAYGTQEGYYNYNDELYYANGDTLFKQTQNGWVIASSPANNLNGYYVGSSYGSDWDGPEFEDIYLRLAETQYQTDQREAERERESRNQNDNNRYSNWSNNDYDDWDIGDTDWDSDW